MLIFFALRRRACPVFAPTGPPWMLWDRGPVREVTITVVPPAARPRHALCWSRKLRPSSTAGAGEEASEQEQQQQRRQQQRQARLCQMVFKHASEALSFEEAFAAVCENPIGQQRKVSLWHVLTSVLKPMPHRLLWSILVGRCGRCAASGLVLDDRIFSSYLREEPGNRRGTAHKKHTSPRQGRREGLRGDGNGRCSLKTAVTLVCV